jgi:hypothetical protein
VTTEHGRVDVLGAKTLDSYHFTVYWLCLELLFSCCVVSGKISYLQLHVRDFYVDFVAFVSCDVTRSSV